MNTPPTATGSKADPQAGPSQPDPAQPAAATSDTMLRRPFQGPGLARQVQPDAAPKPLVRLASGKGPTVVRPGATGAAPRSAPQLPTRALPTQPVPRTAPGLPARPEPPAAPPVRAPAAMAQPRRRHWLLLVSFLVLVVLPSLLWGWYLWARASDQYVSSVGFSVRQEQMTPSIDLLSGLAPFAGGGGGASDTDILYEYIRSQDMVERIDVQLDLRSRFSRVWPRDFVFGLNPEDHIEDMTEYWQRQVKVLYDGTSGLITLNVSAFTPQDAQAIAAAVFQESSDKINELSAIARDDATRLAQAELDKTRQDLTAARQAMTDFRMRSQIVDPQADLTSQMGVLAGLQGQLAEAMVAHDLLIENAPATDHRVIQSQQRIDALRRLIDSERAKFGAEGTGPAGESYSQLMAEYEKLAVDREFAEGAYRSARIAYETALAEARRQSRYLAAHIQPKVAQSSTEPNRPWLMFMVVGLLLTGWSILVLVYYSIRDRG
ncbi:capsule biosynthesis protein [Paracoccus sediminis]|uniref:Capsular polysaccharide transport system permease protein n=1 Tax=Paracoccus sediminis TaxID=1214787 RepID=A0A238Y5R4_9RHOB|nr:capsule biosynthesis protein [Paracoccus sediminis]SNR66360.1 capsular polysaccharide transport system permease protein [Paracoccus sediminis]